MCACACIFSSKKDAKIREQRTKQTLLLACTLTKQSAVVHTTRLVRKRDHLHSPTSIHPSDDDALLLLPDRNADHHRRCKTLERERERDNLLIVQRRRERKNFEEKKKKGGILSSAQLKCIRGIASSKPATTLITRRRGSNRVSAVPPKRTRLRFGRSRSK